MQNFKVKSCMLMLCVWLRALGQDGISTSRNHRLSQVVKDLWRSCGPASISQQGQLWDQIRLFRVLFSQSLRNSNGRQRMPPVGSLVQSMLGFPHKQSKLLLFQFMPTLSCPPSLHYKYMVLQNTPQSKVYLQILKTSTFHGVQICTPKHKP